MLDLWSLMVGTIGIAFTIMSIVVTIGTPLIIWVLKKDPKIVIKEALREVLREDALGKEGEHISIMSSDDTTKPPTLNPEPSDRARELADKIPDDADPYSRALKAITNKDLDKARELLKEAEKNKEEELVNIYETHGLTEYYDGYYAEAAKWIQKLMHFKPDDLYWLQVITQLHIQAGENESAISSAEKAVKISEDKYGRDHEMVATSLNNMAEVFRALLLYDKAEELHQIALSIREQKLGKSHPDVATSLNNLSAVYFDLKRYDEAEHYSLRAIRILEEAGTNHPNLVTFIMSYAAILEESDHKKEALIQYQ
jgi:tetratricopeptide (TPR) repeat protein